MSPPFLLKEIVRGHKTAQILCVGQRVQLREGMMGGHALLLPRLQDGSKAKP